MTNENPFTDRDENSGRPASPSSSDSASVPSQPNAGADGGAVEGAGETPQPPKKKRPERGPRVFGRFAWAITVPFIIYWVGTSFAGYLENVTDRTRLEQAREALMIQKDVIERELARMPTGVRAEWERFLNWDRFKAVVDDPDHAMTIADFREVAQVLYGDLRPELKREPLSSLRERMEEFVLFWEKQEARKHGADPTGVTFEPLGPGGRGGDEIQVSSEIEKLLAEDATTKSSYPTYYTGVAIATLLGIIVVLPVMLKLPVRISGLSVLVGVAGVVAWIGLYLIDHKFLKLGQWLAPSGRAAFNPLEELNETPTWRNLFIGIRMFGLSVLVPIAEEFFLRGWLMRYIDDPDWDEIPIGQAGKLAIYGSIIYGFVAHMGEPLAALAWFAMMTWLFLKTKSVWDCVVAHAVTNFLLGVYVLWTHTWSLW